MKINCFQNQKINFIANFLSKKTKIQNNIIPNNLSLENKNTHELLQQIKNYIRTIPPEFGYFSQCERIFGKQPYNSVLKQNRNCETEEINLKIDKKGFQYYQYQANNLIQDTFVSFQISQLNAFVVSIFDGHGGSQLSVYCAKNNAKIMKEFIKLRITWPKYQNKQVQLIKQAITASYQDLQNNFYKIYKNNLQGSNKRYKGVGTCAITLVIYKDQYILGTCGDSQAIIIQQKQGSYSFKKLSQKYSVNNKNQRQRLIKQYVQTDKDIVVEQRKNVFYLKGILQPTKSIGDYYLKIKQHFFGQGQFNGPYISCQPDIKVYQRKQNDKYILMASDGLWDYLTKWQVLKYVVENKKQKKSISQRQTQSQNQQDFYEQQNNINTANYLCQKVLQKVAYQIDQDISFLKSLQSGSRRNYHDDITISLIDIKQYYSTN